MSTLNVHSTQPHHRIHDVVIVHVVGGSVQKSKVPWLIGGDWLNQNNVVIYRPQHSRQLNFVCVTSNAPGMTGDDKVSAKVAATKIEEASVQTVWSIKSGDKFSLCFQDLHSM